MALFEPLHDAGRGIQTECAAAAQYHCVNLFNQIGWVEQIGFARAGRCAAHIHAAHRAVFEQHHAATGLVERIGCVADFYAGHINKAALSEVHIFPHCQLISS